MLHIASSSRSSSGIIGKVFDHLSNPLARLNEDVDPLILVRGVRIAARVVAANGYGRQFEGVSEEVHGTRCG